MALLVAFWLSEVAARRLGAQALEGVTDGIVDGAAVGLGFAFTEDIFFFFFFGRVGQADLRAGYELFQSRVNFLGHMLGHAICTSLFGAGLGAASVMGRRRRRDAPTGSPWPVRGSPRGRVATSQRTTGLSSLPVRVLPSGLKATLRTRSRWP